jgi:hypothetical protein
MSDREVLPWQGGCDFSAMVRERFGDVIGGPWFNRGSQGQATTVPTRMRLMLMLFNAIATMAMSLRTRGGGPRRDRKSLIILANTPQSKFDADRSMTEFSIAVPTTRVVVAHQNERSGQHAAGHGTERTGPWR